MRFLGLYALLGLFLFANYFANYTNFHHHDSPTYHSVQLLDNNADGYPNINLNQEEEDCLICDFQSLVYHPLNQNFKVAKSAEIPIYVTISEYISSQLSIGQKLSLLLRGPPFLG
ncbi:MAG: hypothetical protein Q4G08_11895 [Capnocytophaga sp.]|nr:hypothetical protein [Capnocytophaga sp.]